MAVDVRMRFENYVVGAANKMAVAAARSVTQEPGLSYNPLVVYGGSGVGKTHLLQAIGNAIAEAQPALKIEYLTLDDFVGQLHSAVAAGETDRFKQRWGRVDVLLLDDIQFLTERRETQSELLRLLEALQGTGRQIVMTSDRPPTEIADVDRRLVTRLAGGLAVDIGPPDFETRVAILHAKCRERGVALEPGVVEAVGRVEAGNVRELQGLLNRVIAFQSLGGEPVHAADVPTLLDGEPPQAEAPGDAAPAAAGGALDFQSFLTDIASAVAEHVEGWKSRVAQAVTGWKNAGYRTHSLERLLDEPAEPANFDALLRGFGAAVKRLKDLESEAVAADPALAGHDVFRDPERLRDAQAMVQRARSGAVELPGPSVEFSRTGFGVGKSNQLAVRAVDAVAAEPGKRYNPLIIHGPSRRRARRTCSTRSATHSPTRAGARRPWRACSAQQFIDEFIGALRDGTVDQWRRRYRPGGRAADRRRAVRRGQGAHAGRAVLPVQRPARCRQAARASRATAARRDLPGLEDRLRSRFEGGLVVELAPPDRGCWTKLFRRFLGGVPAGQVDPLVALPGRPAGGQRPRGHRVGEAADRRRRRARGSSHGGRGEARTRGPRAGAGADAHARRRRAGGARGERRVLPRRREGGVGLDRRPEPRDRGAALTWRSRAA